MNLKYIQFCNNFTYLFKNNLLDQDANLDTSRYFIKIRRLGFEPRLMASKATVLPLDDPRAIS